MHCLVLTGLVAIAASCIVASPLPASASSPLFEPYQEFHSLNTIPKNWEEQQPSPPDALLHFKIGLRQQNVDDFHQKVIDISTPDHPSYGMHMSQAEIHDILRPADDSTQLVLEWLQSHGIQGVLDNHWVKAVVTVSQANKLLQTQYNTYRNVVNGDQVIRTMAYHLPTILADHIDLISPTTTFPTALQVSPDVERWEPNVIDSTCDNITSIFCLQEIYRLPRKIHPGTLDKRNIFGVAGFDGEYANYQDLQLFLSEQRPDFLHTNFTVVSVNGGLNSQNLSEAGTEANLDIQVARGLAPQYKTIFYSVAGLPPFIPSFNTPTNTDEPLDKLLDFLLTTRQKLPHTLSISYGSEEQTYPKTYAERVCRGFAQLGARGVSVIVASGNTGVGYGSLDPTAQECLSNDGKNETRFIPQFLASCPFVTTVGATVGVNPEVAVKRFASGGGFSWYFPRPSYQATAVDEYLAQLPQGLYDGLYNPAGRAFPDVAAQGNYYPIWVGGNPILIGGSSASTQTFAAVITLLNGQRLSEGKKPLGFLNPWLYAQGKHMLNDILSGSNPGCDTPGFSATKGWDPVTGLGTPDYVKMQKFSPR
ncbi:MAG: tripeptidyl peptidase A [Podila humilis]|nr:MAG: tripeptidyl peptidase A [Podila humilis]